jgi:hypothetical protein
MSVTIRGTDNSASTPAVTGTDGDTGLYFPATNQLALATNGTNALTINTSQNVGIGTTSPTAKLHVVNGDVTFVTNDANGYSRITQNSGSAQLGLFRSGTGSNGGGYIGGDGDNCLDIRDSSFVTRARVTQAGLFQMNSGYGSVTTVYGCRAWVNFDGTGSNGAQTIRGSGGVTSIVKTATGVYTFNFASAMPDVNYSPTAWDQNYGIGWFDAPFSVGSFQFRRVNNSFNPTDNAQTTVMVFR